MLGHKLVQVLRKRLDLWTTVRRPFDNIERYGIFDREYTIDKLDVLDAKALRSSIIVARPDVVVNAVGVVKQEPSADPSEMLALNAVLPHTLATLAKELDFRLITISTDCVFSGSKGNYRESESPDPTDFYGKTKVDGEVRGPDCLTLRTSMIGRELDSCHSLVEWMLAHRNEELRGYVNAIFSGFPTLRLSQIIADVITDHPALTGVYHVSSEAISKYDLLKLINDHFNANIRIIPDQNLRIDRSLNSDRFQAETGIVIASWPEMIREMADDPTPYDQFHQTK